MALHDRQEVRSSVTAALASMPGRDFPAATRDLLAALGYRSERTLPDQTGDAGHFIEQFPAPTEGTQSEQAFHEHAASVRILFQVTGDEIASGEQGRLPFAAESFDAGQQQSFLFHAVELKEATYPRGQYARFTREINKRLTQPAVVLFRTADGRLTLSFVHRREHKRDPARDVLGRVSLVREIVPAGPHRAHVDILAALSLAECVEWMGAHGKARNFDGLLAAWLARLDTEELNRRFFRELFDWFQRAATEATFPETVPAEEQVIRLITRILFVWFIKEKGLVAREWFAPAEMEKLLHDFGGADYYRAVLQNLFFATLNTPMDARGFSTRKHSTHRVFSHYRYRSLIRHQQRFLDLMERTPFINGGLFDCLDDEESRSAGGKRIDMFSDPDPDDGPKAAQARREAWRALNVPDALFFDEDGLFPLLDRYKFTVEENTPIEQEVALDPELLGKVFEELLATYNPETRETARKQTGSYYTPREIVDYMVDETLAETLSARAEPDDGDAGYWQERLRYLLDYEDAFDDARELFEESEAEGIVRTISEIRVLDPAVGSGAFPMGMLHKLTLALRRLDPDNQRWKALQAERARERAEQAFETPDRRLRDAELLAISEIFERYSGDFGRKLYLIQNSIFGVDIQPVACQIAKLRFFISLAIEQKVDETADNFGIKPLPNLETRFAAANTLIGLGERVFSSPKIEGLESELHANREQHFHAAWRVDKLKCLKEDRRLRRELARALTQLGMPAALADRVSEWDPYDQNAAAGWFDSEFMFGVADGFDVVIGNPPYIQLQKDRGKLGKLYKDSGYVTFARTGDIYLLFYERGCRLLRPDQGLLAFITSNSWLRAEYGKALRRYLSERHSPLRLVETGKDVFESAIVDTSILIVRHSPGGAAGKAVDMDRLSDKSFPPAESQWGELRLRGDRPWSALSAIEQSIMDKMEAVGTPLKEWDIAINYGIKTGLNEAFVVDGDTREALIVEDPRSAEILKPLLRGRDIQRYRAEWAGVWLIDTHNGYGGVPSVDVEEYPAIKRHLDRFYPRLEKRQDKGRTPYNLRNCAYHEVFGEEKLFWMDMSKEGRFAYSETEMYCNDKGFLMRGEYLKYLCAILNSTLITWLVGNTVLTTGLGLTQWKKFAVERFPVPKISAARQRPFVDLVDRILAAKETEPKADTFAAEAEVDRLVHALYGLTDEEIEAVEKRPVR